MEEKDTYSLETVINTLSHDGGSAVQMMITPIRVACMNALHSARLSANMYLSFRHNQGVNAKNTNCSRNTWYCR